MTEISKKRANKVREEETQENRQYSALRSKIIKILPMVDMDKKLFLQEFLKLLAYADMYFRQRHYMAFYNAGLTIAYCAIQTNQLQLADKVYSLFGQMLFTAKKYTLALQMYVKLRNCAHTHKDVLVKAYACR